MIGKFAIAGTFAAVCSAAVIAQTPATGGSVQTPPSRPGAVAPSDQDRTTTIASQGASMVLTGCLKREEQVPGRSPNIVERQGVMEDYILTNAAPAAAASGAVGTSGTTGAPAAAGSAAAKNISTQYKVEGIPDERLSQLVGKRVEITGRVDADDAREAPTGTTGAGAPAAPGAPGAARPATPAPGADMPEFEAVSIREVAGTCDETR